MENIFYDKSYKDTVGYKIIFNNKSDKHHHVLGGENWNLPECPICKQSMHQLISLDLNDNRLNMFQGNRREELPLFSCLNCSMQWDDQYFKIDFMSKSASIIQQKQEHKEQIDVEQRIAVPIPTLQFTLNEFKEKDYPTSEETYDDIFSDFGVEYIGRVLGKPVLAQDELNNKCCSCHGDMPFIALISGENFIEYLKEKNIDLFFGELILYFSFCLRCEILKVESQSI
ncbi:hypothetical protein ACFWM3_18580 [Gottfriedia sp. NPDC058432]|uniref:hypothetical protein n=1 Tax=Gottfriedia sp. NPDC058432 TaxID=3346497 RepID=UPI00366687E8